MIITKTPYRVSFFGGGTDYPEWYQQYGGEVLSTSIDSYSYVTCRYLPGFYEDKYRIAYRQVESVSSVAEIEHPVVKAALSDLSIAEGLSIHHDGDLPACSGMGSSSTFTVGLLAALNAYKGVYCSPRQLAEKAIYLEQTLLGECVGVQDQIAAAYGGFNHVQISPSGDFDVYPVIASSEKIAQLQRNLLMVFTGQSRFASDFAQSKVQSFAKKKKDLEVMREMVSEGLSLLRSTSDNLDDFGRLLDQSWQLKRGLTSSVSTAVVDEIYALAKRHGALGGKLLGAGGGGFVLMYVPQHAQEKVVNELSSFLVCPVQFSSCGAEVVYCNKRKKMNNVMLTEHAAVT